MTDDPFQCRWVLCHDYGDRDEADGVDLAIIGDVQQHGWHVVMVPEDEIGPGFAYPIGLTHTHGTPELAMFGLDIHAMHRMLNRLGAKSTADAVPADGERHADVIEGRQVALRQVDLRWYRTFFGRAISSTDGRPFPCCRLRGPTRMAAFIGKNRLRRGTGSYSLSCGCHQVSTLSGFGRPNSDLEIPGAIGAGSFTE